MSSLLDKYQRSRKLGYNPRNNGESLYPTLSDHNDKNPVTTSSFSKPDRYNDVRPDRAYRDVSPIVRDRVPLRDPLKSWSSYNKEPAILSTRTTTTSERFAKNYSETKPFRSQLNEERYSRKLTNDDLKSKYNSTYFDSRSSKYGVDRVNQSIYASARARDYYTKRDTGLGSPIKSLNSPLDSTKRKSKSLYKVLGSTPIRSGDYRITKTPRKKHNVQESPGILSRLYKYFSKPGESDDVKILKNSARNVLHIDPVAEKKVAFHEPAESVRTRRQFEFDSEKDVVDEAIRHSKELSIEHQRFKALQQQYNRLEEELKHEISNNEKLVEQFIKDTDDLKIKYEQEKAQLQETIELLNAEIRTKDDKAKEIVQQLEYSEHEKYDLELRLDDLTKELDAQVEKNKIIRTEMELRERLKSKLENDTILHGIYKESAQIEEKIHKLIQEYPAEELPVSLLESNAANKYQRTEENINNALTDLKEFTLSLADTDFEPYDKFYDKVENFLNNAKSKIWNLIDPIAESSGSRNYYEKMLSNLFCLKRLNTLSYKSAQVKNLINDCKILDEYKTSGVDVSAIYQNITQETL
ncbi:uncharacterized protein SPAPADRAFT_64997 [Spathaspora passalidarum NRRL Y-27907]|uniref:Uncharacterized protein n=1 Tax=Spathaspora passalidarum (strain NRRL Y-27907 / 11-Y1) TaxID=619300 RepID=G3AIV7_SPAPN|nr:uncharacterized protein SPAPADRAFT_64997 [Spathaspora passalidarum NRRL Y-27907]EGW33768.1 hypothetical protein SPAPADRAFT_64997 [Spathaspora passalidarum NRRL Y-27907]